MSEPDRLTLYLDVCCLFRAFDDQSQARIRLESEAIRLILARVTSGEWRWVGGEAIRDEVDQAREPERWHLVSTLMEPMTTIRSLGEAEVARASDLLAAGFQAFDALHLASAEFAAADIFLTTDDRLLRTAKRLGDAIRVRTSNPLTWLAELVDESPP